MYKWHNEKNVSFVQRSMTYITYVLRSTYLVVSCLWTSWRWSERWALSTHSVRSGWRGWTVGPSDEGQSQERWASEQGLGSGSCLEVGWGTGQGCSAPPDNMSPWGLESWNTEAARSTSVDTWIQHECMLINCYTRRKEMFYLMTHYTHFIYGYMVSDHSDSERGNHHMGLSFRLTARVLLYASSHRQDNTYHSLCYTSRGALAGMTVIPEFKCYPLITHPTSH